MGGSLFQARDCEQWQGLGCVFELRFQITAAVDCTGESLNGIAYQSTLAGTMTVV